MFLRTSRYERDDPDQAYLPDRVRVDLCNRVFRLADLARVTREWMEAHAVDAVLASSEEALFTISAYETGR